MSRDRFRIGMAQMTSTDRTDLNLQMVKELFLRATSQGANLAVFPENTLYFRIQSGSSILGLKWNGLEMNELQKQVDLHSTSLMLTTPLQDDAGKMRNTTVLFRRNQKAVRVYSKIHLFDVDVEGAPAVRESDFFAAGEAPQTVEIDGWNIGLSICYDLRFAELYLNYAQKVDLILIPSAFLVPTGEAHWHVLIRARAIEAQCYVAAPAQSGEHRSEGGQVRKTYGHSLLVDPWGRIVSEVQSSPEMLVVEMNRDEIVRARRQIPMAGHRRLK